MAEAWQLLFSLAAVAALILLVRHLKLGEGTVLRTEAQVREAGEMALDGFEPSDIAISKDSSAALLTDGEQRVLLLRAHGSHAAGRLLDAQTTAVVTQEGLVITTGDRRFDPITLIIPDPQSWKARIDRVKQPRHA